jgi:hypothetical protein
MYERVKKSFEWISIYTFAGGYINELILADIFQQGDTFPANSIHEVPLFQNILSCKLIYNNTTWRYYYVWACRRYYFEIMELRGYY